MSSIQQNAGTGQSITNPNVFGGGISWTNPGNIVSNNTLYAEIYFYPSEASQYLWATNFGFSIPTYSTIDGIICSYERYTDTTNGIQDTGIYLIKNGTLTGNNKSASAYWTTFSGSTVNFGSPADMWGATLTPSDINSSNFGVALSCQYGDVYGGGTVNGGVDVVSITVYYTENIFSYFGNTQIKKVYYGSTLVQSIMIGNTRVL
jgi:hypothetical protein